MREEALRMWRWALSQSLPRRHYSAAARKNALDCLDAVRYFSNPDNPVYGTGWSSKR